MLIQYFCIEGSHVETVHIKTLVLVELIVYYSYFT